MSDNSLTPPAKYTKGDLRRMLAVLGAIHQLKDEATLVQIARLTSYNTKTIQTQIERAVREACVEIAKDGPRYTVVDWGPVIKQRSAMLALAGNLGTPSAESQSAES